MTVTSGFCSIKASARALTTLSMEVEPSVFTVPLRVVVWDWTGVELAAGVLVGVEVVPLEPQPASRPAIRA